jgi:hypothetical protein
VIAVVQSDDETEEPVRVVEITAYIMVERPLPPQQRGRPAKVSENEKYLQQPPFKFLSSDNYATFIVKISQALPCSALNIVEDAISWKPQTPKSSALLLLGGETGYSSMVDHFVGKKQGHVVMLMMPPPRKPVEKPVRFPVVKFYMLLIGFISSGMRVTKRQIPQKSLIMPESKYSQRLIILLNNEYTSLLYLSLSSAHDAALF